MIAGRDSERMAGLSSELKSPFVSLDVGSADQFEECLVKAKTEFGGVTGVVNCIGSLFLKPAHRTSPEEWDATLATNLGSAFATVRAAARTMRPPGGSVVLVSSAAALTGLPNHEAIAAAKAGIVGLTRSAAASYAHSRLRFNAVAPGLVNQDDPPPLVRRFDGGWVHCHAPLGSARRTRGCGLVDRLASRPRQRLGDGPDHLRGRWSGARAFPAEEIDPSADRNLDRIATDPFNLRKRTHGDSEECVGTRP